MPERVLLCDDEIHILRAAEFKLSKAGFQVECAYDGEQGWEIIQRHRPDILVTDLQMPRLNGYELAQRVRDHRETRDLPIIMLTAKGYEMTQFDVAARWGVAAILSKPFSPRELLKTVQRTLEEAAVESAAAADGGSDIHTGEA